MMLAKRSVSVRSTARAPARGRSTCVNVQARGPIVTKKGVAFKQMPDEPEDDPEDIGAVGTALIALGLPANPICLWSEFTLATTGAGLPEGPGGALGAAEGISYLVVVGVVAYSLYTKVNTGKGLPAGPAGLLGAVEGFSYLSLLGGLIAFAVSTSMKA